MMRSIGQRENVVVRPICVHLKVALSVASLIAVVGLASNADDTAKGKEVTAKEIETFGSELLGKKCQMDCTFREVSNTWVKLWLEDESIVGVFVDDARDELFQYVFADRAKFGRALLKLKKGDRIRIVGSIRKVKSNYVLMAEEMELPEARKERPSGEKEVTAKEIETFGNELLDKPCEMVCTLDEVSNTWVRLWLEDAGVVGLFVTDDKGDLFQHVFANKSRFGDKLKMMRKGDSLRLIGTVKRVKKNYVFMVDDIR